MPVNRSFRRLPLRVRLIAGFALAMLVVLAAAGAFVYLRVQYALDLRLDEDLATQSAQLVTAVRAGTPDQRPPMYQVLDPMNRVMAASPGETTEASLLTPAEAAEALRGPVRADLGGLFAIQEHTFRLYAVPLGAQPSPGQPAIAVVAVRRDQRDETLRELIAQLTLANLVALAVASLVGYRLARAALAPVERYRTQAARIAAGATGVRLEVPAGADDEVARLGRTLNDMLAALDAALDRERRFVNDASHELRTPLTLLSTELELALRRPRTPAELEATLRGAAADTADLIALADGLLAVGVQPVQDDVAPEVDLGKLVTAVAARYADPPVRAAVEPGLITRGDERRLRQVVTNVLDNAARHGAPPVEVTADRAGSAVRLLVHDTGPGMTAEFLPRATERFSRADATRTSPGTGLGLSLVLATVRAHHGELWLCSNGEHHRSDPCFDSACTHPTSGTTVTVLLPSAQPARRGAGGGAGAAAVG